MSLLLTQDELFELTGYKQPTAQVEELKRQGFYRARRNPAGTVVLERAHYEAVCSGLTVGGGVLRKTRPEPQLMLPEPPRQRRTKATA